MTLHQKLRFSNWRVSCTLAALAMILPLAGCSGSDAPAPPTAPSGPTVTQVTVQGPDSCQIAPAGIARFSNHTESCVNPNETIQVTAQATMSDGFTRDVTTDADWTTSAPNQATVNGTGQVTGADPFGGGSADIRATYEGVSGTWPVRAIRTITDNGVDVRGTWSAAGGAFTFAADTYQLTLVGDADFLASGPWSLAGDVVSLNGQIDNPGATGLTQGATYVCTGNVTPPDQMVIVCLGELSGTEAVVKE